MIITPELLALAEEAKKVHSRFMTPEQRYAAFQVGKAKMEAEEEAKRKAEERHRNGEEDFDEGEGR